MEKDFFRAKVFFLSLLVLGGLIITSGSAKASTLYQLPITIYNATSTLTDYQVKVTFQPSEFNFARASSTGADIYFTDASSTTINHFIQTFSNSGTSTIWVKVPVLAANATTTIYMNYGDDTVTATQSSSTGTFLFYDGFDNGSVADWTTSSQDVDQAGESAGLVAGSDKYVSPYYSAKLSAVASCASLTFNGATAIMARSLEIPTGSYKIDFDLYQQIPRFSYFTSAWLTSSLKVNGASVWSETPGCSGWNCTYDSGWKEESIVATGTISSLSFLNYASDCATTNVWVDDLMIRNYDSVEPVVTFTPDPAPEYNLSYSAGDGGSITGSLSQVVYFGYDGSAVTAVANSGYRFVSWSDQSTANPRIDTGVSGDISVSAVFEVIPQAPVVHHGGAIIILPPGIGSGNHDSTASVIGSTLQVGAVNSSGVNVLTFATNLNNFTIPESGSSWQLGSHSFQITNLDLYNNIATLVISSNPQTIQLKKGESRDVDLDGDKINDLKVIFTNVYVNRAEITLKSLTQFTSLSNSVPPVAPAASPRFIFKKNLSSGMVGNDVKELQKFLNASGYAIAKSGAGSPGRETTRFGSATKTALIKFQKANKIHPANGSFGPLTRGVANR